MALHYYLILLVILHLHLTAVAAPARTLQCVVKGDLFKGVRSDCSRGNLEEMANVASAAAPRGESFGAGNMAELILARIGVFEDINPDNLKICSKHKNELGIDWAKSRPIMRKSGRRVTRCDMPELAGSPYEAHSVTDAVVGHKFLSISQSRAIWRQLLTLVPAGTAMCTNHKNYVDQIVRQSQGAAAADDVAEAAETEDVPEDAGEGTSDQAATASTSRKRPQTSLVESPPQYRGWEATRRGATCSAEDLPLSQGSAYSQSGTSEGSLSQETSAAKRARKDTCDKVKSAVRDIGTAIGLTPSNLNFAQSYRDLDPASKAKRAQASLRVTDAVMSAFAPDAPGELFEAITYKRFGIASERQKSEKFRAMIENVVDQYMMAPTRQARLQTLAAIAPLLRYPELEQYIPGLTHYAYKTARLYAKRIKAGMPEIPPNQKREKYDKRKVETFIAFITSPMVVSDMPFGHVTVRRSTGVKEELPNLIRTTVNKRIIMQYKSYLTDTGKEHLRLSDSTMWRILRNCKATTRKSMLGLDYFTYEGVSGVDNLINLAGRIAAKTGDADWEKKMTQELRNVKAFLKGDYKVYIQQQSEFSDYSRWYALSDPNNPLLKAENPPGNMRRCGRCIAMIKAFNDIQDKIATIEWQVQRDQLEAEYEFEASTHAIFEWQKHLMRTANQNLGKDEILQNLGADEVWVLMDWAMKFIPKKGTESQPDWYGKRGISWHISVAFRRDPKDFSKYQHRTFVHIFDPVAQDAETVIAIIRDVIERMKVEMPSLKKVYLRSDNAVCYHSGPTLAAIPLISSATRVEIARYDFSDPQSGKGACDRATSVIKRHVKIYVDGNRKCSTAAEFFECCSSQGGVTSATFIHAGLTTDAEISGRGSIAQITNYHNFQFNTDSTQGWRAYKIGRGKQLAITPRSEPLPKLHPVHAASSGRHRHHHGMSSDEFWIMLSAKSMPTKPPPPPNTDSDDGWVPDETAAEQEVAAAPSAPADDPVFLEGEHRQLLYQCEQEGCTKVFQSYRNYYRHVSIGKHTMRVERQSLRDFSIDTYVRRIEESQVLSGIQPILDAIRSERNAEAAADQVPPLPMGWALKTTRANKRFTPAQKEYLIAKFNEGATSGQKYNPQDVAVDMRKQPQFPSKDLWLTWTQIASFWSRLAQQREKSGGAATTSGAAATTSGRGTHQTEPDDEDYDLEALADDEYANAFGDHVDEVIQNVVNEAMDRS